MVFQVAAFSIASCIIVINHNSLAFFSISFAEAFHRIKLSNLSFTTSTSCVLILHLYPVFEQLGHQFHL